MSSRGQSKQQAKLLDSKIGFPDLMVVFHNESKTGKSFVPPVYSKQTVVPSFILCFFE